MDDQKIIELYFERDERAIEETRDKYGRLLAGIAYNILHSLEDTEECVDDTYLKAWQVIPPEKPTFFQAFLAKITRNLSINRYIQNKNRKKLTVTDSVITELTECVPSEKTSISDNLALRDAINSFLASLDKTARIMFVKRYFYVMPISQVAHEMGMTVSNVKVSLMRTREKFKTYLEKAGISI